MMLLYEFALIYEPCMKQVLSDSENSCPKGPAGSHAVELHGGIKFKSSFSFLVSPLSNLFF